MPGGHYNPEVDRYNAAGLGVLPQFNVNPQGSIDPYDSGNPLNDNPAAQYSQPDYGLLNNTASAVQSAPSFGPQPSAGGWNIDQYGNLQNTAVQTGQNVGRTVGGFIGGDLGRYVPLPGAPQLGAFLGRQAGSLVGHGIGGLFGSIGHGLSSLFGGGAKGISSLFGGGQGDNSTPPSDAPTSTGDSNTSPQYSQGPSRDWQSLFNTGRVTGAPGFSQTLAQSQFGNASMIGPIGGGNMNPYGANGRAAQGLGTPGFAGGYGGSLDSGTSAFQSFVATHTTK